MPDDVTPFFTAAQRRVVATGIVLLSIAVSVITVIFAVLELGRAVAFFSGVLWPLTLFRAGKNHPAAIRTSQRLPNTEEIAAWNTLNAEQSIPHADTMTINGPVPGPEWMPATGPRRA